jgi:hypothetical protein
MNGSNPWPLVATAIALVLITSTIIAALAWTTADVEWRVEAPATEPPKAASVRMGAVASQATAMSPPPPYALAACRRQASQLRSDDASLPPALKAGVVGVGPVQHSDPRYREAYALCMRSRGYSN